MLLLNKIKVKKKLTIQDTCSMILHVIFTIKGPTEQIHHNGTRTVISTVKWNQVVNID